MDHLRSSVTARPSKVSGAVQFAAAASLILTGITAEARNAFAKVAPQSAGVATNVVSSGPSEMAAQKEKLAQEMRDFEVEILALAGHVVNPGEPISAMSGQAMLGNKLDTPTSSVGGKPLDKQTATTLLKMVAALQGKISQARNAADIAWINGAKAEVIAGINEEKIKSVTAKNVEDATVFNKTLVAFESRLVMPRLQKIIDKGVLSTYEAGAYQEALADQAFLRSLTPVSSAKDAAPLPAITGGEERAEKDAQLTPEQQEAVERARIRYEAGALMSEAERLAKESPNGLIGRLVSEITSLQALSRRTEARLLQSMSNETRTAMRNEAKQMALELLMKTSELKAAVRSSLKQ